MSPITYSPNANWIIKEVALNVCVCVVGTASVALSTRLLVASLPSYRAGITSSAVSGQERKSIEMGQFLTATTYCILYGIYC